MTEITITTNTATIKVNDYAFEILLTGCLVGMFCVASSIAFYMLQIALGIVLIIIMVGLMALCVHFLFKHRKSVLNATLEHKLLALYRTKENRIKIVTLRAR